LAVYLWKGLVELNEEFPGYVSVDYGMGEGEVPGDYLTIRDKLERAVEVCLKGLQEYRNPAIMWTGGKDSTLVLYVVKDVAEDYGFDVPPVVFIDHFQHFEEITDFVEHWADKFGVEIFYARNEDVRENAGEPGDEVQVKNLSERNRREVREKLEYEEDTFPFLLDTYVGNHLLKTVALNETLEELDIDGIFSGVRWDEQEARADETFFSPRHDVEKYPSHDRIHPILQFDEESVWDATWHFLVPDVVEECPDEGHVPRGYDDIPGDLTQDDLPVSPKYFEGFRSLGSEVSTKKSEDVPAWLQDLEGTTERAGRAQDKEDLMERLRDLGYM